jgi:Flp pilus assembly pilin Flp
VNPRRDVRRPSQATGGEGGAAAIEYGLFLAAIAALCIGVVTILGDDVIALYDAVRWW